MKNYRKHLTPPQPLARIVLACVFAASLFSCKITTDEPDTFTVAFNANGGSGSIESITKTENEEFELPANTFTKTGFTFAGWNTKSTPDESSKSYKDKEKIKLTEDLTLYAQWEEIAKVFYTVKFDANGGTGEMNKITAESGIEIAITENSFTKAGWTFSGWNTKSDGTGAPYNDKTKITLTADITLYAQWAAGTGTAYKVEHWQQNITDDDYTLAKTEPMTGTTGEETAAKAEETAGFSAKEFVQEKIAADGSTVVKIHYDRKIITLTFDADNGGEKTVRSGRFGTEIVPPFPEKTDFNFNGWSTKQAPDESSKSYKDKEKIKLTADVTLYAQWKKNPSYSINYNLNEGTNPEDARTSYKQDETVVLPVPTREFYYFAGWHLTQDFSDEVIKGWNAGERTDAVTLYAKWAVKAENVVNVIKNLPEGTHNICVVGEIDETTVKNIERELLSKKNAKVNLDLSGTTGLESIPSRTFSRCIKLVSIKIPASVTSIGDSAFYGCTSLTTIEIPASVTSIGKAAFAECTSLTTIEIPESVTSIGKAAFEKCTSLTTIKIPESVTSIGDYAFQYCTNLTNIEIPESVTSIGNHAFYECTSLTTIKIPESVTSIDNATFLGCTNLTNIEIPESVTSIGDGAFEDCTNLTNIEIPKSVTSIGGSAFQYCTNLTNIAIPASVTSIGEDAFVKCTSLTTIEIPESVTSIDNATFYGCTNLTNIEIPTNVTSIDNYAFSECTSLTNIKIPASVTSIGFSAFDGCTKLTTVNFLGTIEQWNSISIDSWNKNLTSAKIICTDGIINGE